MLKFCRIFQIRSRRNVQGTRRLPRRLPGRVPGGSPQFAFSRKTPHTAPPKKLASSSARPAAALRDVAAEVLRARPLGDALREHGGPRRQHGRPARLGAQERAAPRRRKAILFCQMWKTISNFSMFFKPANFRQNSTKISATNVFFFFFLFFSFFF